MKINRILYSRIGAVLLILPFIKPASEITGRLDILFDLLKIIAIAIIAIGYFSSVKSKMKANMIIVFIQCVFIISTVFHQGDIKTAVVDAGSNISICWYMELLLNKGCKIAARNFAIPCVILAVIAATSIYYFYPTGMYMVGVGGSRANYFWGFDNSSAFRFLPTMFFLSIYSFERNEKKTYWFTLLFLIYCTGAFLYVRSLTAGAFFSLFTLAYVFLLLRKRGLRHINIRSLLLVIVIISVVLIIYKDDITGLMDFAIKNDKFGSMKLRFNIWRNTIKQWLLSPVLGWGVENPNVTYSKLLLDHPHNLFLDVLYHGGLVAFGGLVYLLYMLFESRQWRTRINMMTAIGLVSIIAIAQMDYYNSQYLIYPMLIFSLYADSRSENNPAYIEKCLPKRKFRKVVVE